MSRDNPAKCECHFVIPAAKYPSVNSYICLQVNLNYVVTISLCRAGNYLCHPVCLPYAYLLILTHHSILCWSNSSSFSRDLRISEIRHCWVLSPNMKYIIAIPSSRLVSRKVSTALMCVSYQIQTQLCTIADWHDVPRVCGTHPRVRHTEPCRARPRSEHWRGWLGSGQCYGDGH